jgi:hypothetical protein
MAHLFEYATAIQYMTPVGTPDLSNKQAQLGFLKSMGNLTKNMPKMLESLEGGGWDVNSHNIMFHDNTFVITFLLQRMVVSKS